MMPLMHIVFPRTIYLVGYHRSLSLRSTGPQMFVRQATVVVLNAQL